MTRPADQAALLCESAEALGCRVVRFPVLEIQFIADDERAQSLFQQMDDYACLLFVSQNAVEACFRHYLDPGMLPGAAFIAIGKSTAQALQSHGIRDVQHADTVADSEALLALPVLQTRAVKNRKILIIRGQGGRELLSKTLQERGAQVDIAEVYLRQRPQYGKNECDQLWQQATPDAIIVTSNDGIRNLVSLTPEACRATLFATPLVVMSARNADFAREQGFNADIAVAAEKNDAGLIDALSELLEKSHL